MNIVLLFLRNTHTNPIHSTQNIHAMFGTTRS